MAMSFGQTKGNGHSHGPLGHGGHMDDKSMKPSGSASHTANPHTQGSSAGHTMSNSHGGGFPVGC
jgi:hypothetical protein